MSIRHAILGFLSWKPFTGYELKKLFADALSFHWSGNSNQIYGSLLELGRDGAVSVEVRQQEKLPARKVYTISPRGREELRAWLLSEAELPSLRSLVHTRLAWAECLTDGELDGLLEAYGRTLADQILMYRETLRRGAGKGMAGGADRAPADGTRAPGRSPRERLIWDSIETHTVEFYERERAWARSLQASLAELGGRK